MIHSTFQSSGTIPISIHLLVILINQSVILTQLYFSLSPTMSSTLAVFLPFIFFIATIISLFPTILSSNPSLIPPSPFLHPPLSPFFPPLHLADHQNTFIFLQILAPYSTPPLLENPFDSPFSNLVYHLLKYCLILHMFSSLTLATSFSFSYTLSDPP